MYTDPTIAEFKTYFTRDFPYGTDINTSVTDDDISRALSDCSLNINQGLFESQAEYTYAFLQLSAHFLVMNLRASSQGLSGQYAWLQTSKSVGSVSEGLQVPQRILDNPELAMLSKTNYGAAYLAYVLPKFIGKTFYVPGRTLA